MTRRHIAFPHLCTYISISLSAFPIPIFQATDHRLIVFTKHLSQRTL